MAIYDPEDDAREWIENFTEAMVEMIIKDGKVSEDPFCKYDGGERFFTETQQFREYSLLEAATILDEFGDHKEEDEGFWNGLSPHKAVEAQAAQTYSNAVRAEIARRLKNINEAVVGWQDFSEEEARKTIIEIAY
jgi:hypothetical protein